MPTFQPIIHTIEGRTVRIWAVADVHIGSAECDLSGFTAFTRRIAADPDAFLVIAGDLFDNALCGSKSDLYAAAMSPRDALSIAVRLLSPVSDRILAIVAGNHEERTWKAVGIDLMEQFAVMVGCADVYRREMAFVRLNMVGGKTGKDGRRSLRDSKSLLVVHGKTAAKAKKFSYAVEGVDILISGHTHEGIVTKPARLCFTQQNNVVVKPLAAITATSWLSYGGYGAAGMYLPNATSDPQCVEVEWTNSNNNGGNVRVIW